MVVCEGRNRNQRMALRHYLLSQLDEYLRKALLLDKTADGELREPDLFSRESSTTSAFWTATTILEQPFSSGDDSYYGAMVVEEL